MSGLLGPLDSEGRVPPSQQTRVAAFLISAHGALARQFALALPAKFEAGWQTELNAQLYRESEIVSLLMRATTWVPDLALGYMAVSWEAPGFRRRTKALPIALFGKQSTSPRSRMPSTPGSGQRRYYRLRQTRMTPS